MLALERHSPCPVKEEAECFIWRHSDDQEGVETASDDDFAMTCDFGEPLFVILKLGRCWERKTLHTRGFVVTLKRMFAAG